MLRGIYLLFKIVGNLRIKFIKLVRVLNVITETTNSFSFYYVFDKQKMYNRSRSFNLSHHYLRKFQLWI